ncbi:MAG: FixH family protein [Smithellaceae bacterium]|nr:FixH family protein [Smithellaceae bacterium]
MKRLALIICVLFLAVGLVYAKDYEMTKKAGDYTVQVTIDKNPPVTGNNNVAVGIKDGAGKDVTDAAVAIDYGMPAMPGMPAMNYKTDTTLKGKRYAATLNFSMSGPWSVAVKITHGGKTQSVKLNVDVK